MHELKKWVIGVVGAGRMGLALARLMRRAGHSFIFYDVDSEALRKASARGFRTVDDLGELIGCADAVMVAVGHSDIIQSLRGVRDEIITHKAGRVRLVFDIATFKEEIMREYSTFPDYVMVASAHPLFGPGARSPEKHRVIIVPVPGRLEGASALLQIFSSSGFETVAVEPEKHDKLMSYVIGLTYLVATASAGVVGEEMSVYAEFAGTTFKLLQVLMGAVANDTTDFITYVITRPQVREIGEKLIDSAKRALEEPGRAAERLRNIFSEEEVRTLYKKLYECVEGLHDDA